MSYDPSPCCPHLAHECAHTGATPTHPLSLTLSLCCSCYDSTLLCSCKDKDPPAYCRAPCAKATRASCLADASVLAGAEREPTRRDSSCARPC